MDRRKEKNPVEQPLGEQILESLGEMEDALSKGERLHERFTMRRVELELEPRSFTAEEVRALREVFRASQTVFAKLLGVKPSTLRNWEQGRQTPPAVGRRLMEVMEEDPDRFREKLEHATRASPSGA